MSWRAQGNSSWQTIAPGVELRALRTSAGDGAVSVIALRTSPARLRIVTGANLDTAGWRRRFGAVAAINGGFFDPAQRPLGLRVASGRRVARLRSVNWGVFFVNRGKARILHTRDFARSFKSLQGIHQAVQSGPRLVVNGRPTDLKPQWARRSGLGVQRDGKVVIAVADGDVSLRAWAALWAARDGLNCRDALNLDGGGSTQLALQTKRRTLEVTGSWPVPDAIVIK